MVLNWMRRAKNRRSQASPLARRARVAPAVECLESRTLLSFATPTSMTLGAFPRALGTGDFNGDGRPDLVVTTAGNHMVNVLLSNGDGTFKAPVSINVGTNPTSVAVGDFNGDGKLDLAVGNTGDIYGNVGNTIYTLLGNGDGTFQAPVSRAAGLQPFDLVLADVNGDGKMDIVASGDAKDSGGNIFGEVSTLLGNGNGTFQAPVSTGTGLLPTFLATGDFNGDGHPDVLTMNSGGSAPGATLLLGTGSAAFQFGATFNTGVPPATVAVSDLNGDGHLDFAVANSGGTVRVFMGNGDGTFQNPIDYTIAANATMITSKDFNGDGKPDLIVAAGSNNSVSLLINNGDGTFTSTAPQTVGSYPIALASADFNGDGRPDLITANYLDGTINALLGLPSGTQFTLGAPVSVAGGKSFQLTITAMTPTSTVDVNYIGTVHFTSSDASAVLPADYSFTAADHGVHTFSLTLGKVGAETVTATDLVSASTTGNASIIVRGQHIIATSAGYTGGPEVKVMDAATGTILFDFMAYNIHFTGGVRIAVGDVTGDGVPDIVTAAGPTGGPHIKVFDGVTGALVRDWMAYSRFFSGGVQIAVGDVNHDGYADIITGADAGGGPHVKVFSGRDGSVLYSFFPYNVGFTGGVRVAAGDVNGDGYADIITGAGPGGGPHVQVFSGKDLTLMDSFFAYSRSFGLGVYVAAGDINGDGKADIITGAGIGGGPHVKVFSGADPSVVLASFMAFGMDVWSGVRVGYVGDVNGDGHGDIVVGTGPGRTAQVVVLDSQTLAPLDAQFLYSGFAAGIFVGGA